MRNFLRNVDFDQVKDQITDIKDQLSDIRFRKPWTKGRETSPLIFVAVGAALAVAGITLYKKRKNVAKLCASCGEELKDRWESSGMKDKAEKIMSKVKNGVPVPKDQPGQERYQPN